MFSTRSRYYSLATLKYTMPDGTEIGYVSRRFLPAADEFDLLVEHRVAQNERLDNISARYLEDPEQFWRICDANEAMSPFELTAMPGNTIRITLPQGVARPRDA